MNNIICWYCNENTFRYSYTSESIIYACDHKTFIIKYIFCIKSKLISRLYIESQKYFISTSLKEEGESFCYYRDKKLTLTLSSYFLFNNNIDQIYYKLPSLLILS